jgi:EpsI family protein
MNRLVDPWRKEWKVVGQRHRLLTGVGMTVDVSNVKRTNDRENPAALRVWDWYRIGKYHVVNPYIGKLREVQNLLLEGRTDGAYIVVATTADLDVGEADTTLQRFVQDMLPTIDQAVERSVFGDPDPNRQ